MGFDDAGNLYILDPGAFQVVVIDVQGQLVRTIGRVGEGPGEFGFPFELVVWRDGRFAVQDLRHDAIQVFGRDGEFDHAVSNGTHPPHSRPSGRIRTAMPFSRRGHRGIRRSATPCPS